MRPSVLELKPALFKAGVERMPARNHAVVAGYPDEEGNSVEVVRGLARRGVSVYWLVDRDPSSLTWLIADVPESGNIRCVRKSTMTALWAYSTARYVFFTHGLYGSPSPPANKIFVNLWHGDGPKQRKGFADVRSTFVVSGTRLWGSKRPKSFGVSEDRVLVTGNPRVDQFARPAIDERLEAVGIDATKPLVLWLPTYRKASHEKIRIGHIPDWSDTEELSTKAQVGSLLTEVADFARELGVTLAIKPHPLDADKYLGTGIRRITGENLRSARLTLYQLLARAHGLITDYSSIWTDFLVINRPTAFFCPDLDDYERSRGLNVEDYLSLLPGPLLETSEQFRTFLQSCIDEPESSKNLRAQSIVRIGAETRTGATERLLDAVGIHKFDRSPLDRRA